MKFSVACNFEDALLDGLAPYPVYEIYGKLTTDYVGGGRPSFYLPEVGRKEVESFVKKTHEKGIEFNYLLNASSLDNTEYTREGQGKFQELLEWVDGIGADSVTVANINLLRMVKRRAPGLKVRISSHRFTDNARKVRFWVDNGADYIVVSETNIHREFKILEAMKKAAGDVELQLIVNNWCRQDCAIAGNHAVGLSAASRGGKGFPLDYCSLVCNQLRLNEPVNYLRANWIRPEDLHYYEDMGYHNFKIVERNTPTPILLKRVAAYNARKYDGNLLDLVQNYAYPAETFGEKGKQFYSKKRLVKYFLKPRTINLTKLTKVIDFGKTASVLYPLEGKNPVQIDNRALDGFLDRFETKGCMDDDCESCGYCQLWADKTVKIDPNWAKKMKGIYTGLIDDIDSGSFWDPYTTTLKDYAGRITSKFTQSMRS